MKKLYYSSFILLSLSTAVLLYLVYLLLWPFTVVTLDESPIRVSPKIVCSGDTIDLDLQFTKHMNIVPNIEYYLINHDTVKIETNTLSRPLGKQKRMVELNIPPAHEGPHVVQIQLTYWINRLRPINYVWQTELFQIKNCETKH